MLGGKRFEQRELHVGAHELGVALREQHRPRETRGFGCEAPGVDHARSGHRINTQAIPREIGERQAGHDLDFDARSPQQHDGALRNRRTTRHCVQDLPVLVRGFDHSRRDRRVDRVEIVARVVQQVERIERDALTRKLFNRRMARGPRVAHRHCLESGARDRQQQIDTGRAEPDHHDARRAHPPCGAVVAGASVVVVVGFWSRAVRGVGCDGGVTA